MKKLFVSRWFLFALAIVLLVGISQGKQLAWLVSYTGVRYGIVATVMFIMAFPLDAGAMLKSLRRPWPVLLAVAINFGLLPLVAWGMSHGLNDEMAGGLFIAVSTPSTLASASVWTRRAGGNDAVAILVTVITNLSCFLLTPLWLLWMTGMWQESESLELKGMIIRLALIVVTPMTVAQILRLAPRIGRWATRQKTPLGVLAQIGVLAMIFLGSIRTGERLAANGGSPLDVSDFSWMVVIVIFVHLSMLATGMWLAFFVGFAREDRIAVGIAGSQKTLMIGLQVGLEVGLSILPIVVYHVGQLLLDTFIADRLRRQPKSTAPCRTPD